MSFTLYTSTIEDNRWFQASSQKDRGLYYLKCILGTMYVLRFVDMAVYALTVEEFRHFWFVEQMIAPQNNWKVTYVHQITNDVLEVLFKIYFPQSLRLSEKLY